MLKSLCIFWVILVQGIFCQFAPGFSSPFAPPWGRGSNSPRPGQQIANIINAQPLGLNEEQGQQLFNQIAGQVLQNMGSTAQLRSFNSPDGIDQRFNSFTPQQLMPPGASPLGFTDGSNPSLQPSGFGNNNFNWRNNFEGGSPLTSQFSMNPQIDPRLQRSILTGRNRPRQNTGLDNIQLQRDVQFMNNGLTSRDIQTSGMSDFPEVIPVDPSSIPNTEDPIGRALQRNTRLKERLNALNAIDDKVSVTGSETNALQEIRRENRRLRKLLRQKQREQNNYEQSKTIIAHQPPPPPPPPPKPQKKNNNLGVGLLLGAIGALAFG